MNKNACLFIACLTLMLSCKNDSAQPVNTLFSALNSEATGITFSNDLRPSKELNIFNYRNFYNGGGVAIGDINNDGLVDIYFTANQNENKLYLNEGNLQFRDITTVAGVAGSRPWSTGVTMVDINGDRLLDIYVLNSADMAGNNRENELFINQGDLTFKEEAQKYNLNNNAYSVHASFFDYDGDGDLDCYLVNNSFKGTGPDMRRLLSKNREEIDELGGDKLLRNDGGVFTDVSQQSGIYQGAIGFGLGAIVGDVNQDYWPDIYVSNDFWERDYLYINQGDGTFAEQIIPITSHVSQSSMGSDMADINNDGALDIFTTDMLPSDAARTKTMTVFEDFRPDNPLFHDLFHHQYVQNTLQLNNGNGTFSELGFLAGVAATDWSWGALIFDFNNNGWKDIFVSNGIYRDITDMDFHNFISDRSNIAKIANEKGEFSILDLLERMPSKKIENAAFLNNSDKTFTRNLDSLGFQEPSFSNGAAYGDLDNDGDLDLVVNNLNEPSFIYRNNAERYMDNHYVRLKFEGTEKNTMGIGASVKIYSSGEQQIAANIPSRSFQSSVPPAIHFGLGNEVTVDSLKVVWPDRTMQTMRDIKTDQEIIIKKQEATQSFTPKSTEQQEPLLVDITGKSIAGDITHKENTFNDFEKERLLPYMLSATGPKLAVSDVNGDGLEDFLMTGSRNDQDKLFYQQPGGRFIPHNGSELVGDSLFESTAAEFFDMDNDGDLDIMIGSGGNQFGINSPENQIRVYKNSNNGTFSRASKMAPNIRMEASTINANDFDADGDADVFIGARSTPGSYGMSARSYLLQNNGEGQWKDITPAKLKQAGMITDAIWTDYDADSDKDLIVVGEWMPVLFFKNDDGILEYDYSLENSSGWWSVIKEADLDSDDDMDYILGNWGLNSKFQATPKRPMTMHTNDFKGDGESEFLISTYQPGEDQSFPFPTYDDLIAEMPFLKNRIPDHHAYAGKTYEEIFTASEQEGAQEKIVETLHTSILINDDGKFSLKALPNEAQVSPVYGIISDDFNDDGNTDLLLMGNQHGLKPEVGRLGNNYGVFLFSDGSLNYNFVPYTKTGVFMKGQVRDASTINIGDKRRIIITKNDDELIIFQ